MKRESKTIWRLLLWKGAKMEKIRGFCLLTVFLVFFFSFPEGRLWNLFNQLT
jgi:hypothetical protein